MDKFFKDAGNGHVHEFKFLRLQAKSAKTAGSSKLMRE